MRWYSILIGLLSALFVIATRFFELLSCSLILVVIIVALSSCISVWVLVWGSWTGSGWVTARSFAASLVSFCGSRCSSSRWRTLQTASAASWLVDRIAGVISLPMLLRSGVSSSFLTFHLDFSLIIDNIVFCIVVSIDRVFPWGLTFSPLWFLVIGAWCLAFDLTRSDQFWRRHCPLNLMLPSRTFWMQEIAAVSAQKLFAHRAQCCAFLFLTLFTNSDPLVMFVNPWLLIWGATVLLVVAPRAQENLAVGAATVDLGWFAQLTCKIHS